MKCHLIIYKEIYLYDGYKVILVLGLKPGYCQTNKSYVKTKESLQLLLVKVL